MYITTTYNSHIVACSAQDYHSPGSIVAARRSRAEPTSARMKAHAASHAEPTSGSKHIRTQPHFAALQKAHHGLSPREFARSVLTCSQRRVGQQLPILRMGGRNFRLWRPEIRDARPESRETLPGISGRSAGISGSWAGISGSWGGIAGTFV